uniref:DUF569 domain-containing protein n=1 Tax=Oryza sativa subsp. japonica TaxID=39947 RepID=Q6YYP2_ORYSJ|nr:hypothetical protein [Oryza sativa Japonica Group]
MESLSNVLARQPMMEVFQEVEFAALRIWKSGSYLHADEDGRSVYVGSLPRDGGGDSRHCAVWAVEPPIDAAAPLPQYVRLRGAYGRYLGAPDSYGSPLPFLSVDAAQRDRDRVEMDAIIWQPVACSGSDVVGGRDARGVVLLRDRYGRYLRGSNNLLAPRRSVPSLREIHGRGTTEVLHAATTTQGVQGRTWTQGGARRRSTEFDRWNRTLQAAVPAGFGAGRLRSLEAVTVRTGAAQQNWIKQ